MQKIHSNILFLSLFLLLKVTTLFAQNTGIYLVDSLNKLPVQNAFVQNDDLQFSKTSDENGFINLQTLPPNTLVLKVSCIGFKPKNIFLNEVDFSHSQPIIYLEPTTSTISEVTINAFQQHEVFKTISDLDIHLRPINNSQEVLRMVPGLFIGQHAGGGKAEQIFLRGFDLDHGTDINIVADGIPVNMVSHAHGQGYADLHFIIPELIDKVNFNKGPYFADKGNFTTAGYVDFKTKNHLENNFVKAEGGQFSTLRGVTGINLMRPTFDKINQSLYCAAEGLFTKGYFDSPQNFTRLNGLLKYHRTINSNHSLSVTLSSFTSGWMASGQIPNRAVESGLIGFYGAIDNKEGGNTSRYNISAQWLSNLNKGATLRSQIYYCKYLFELYSNFTFFKEDSINGDQIRQKENRDMVGLHTSYSKDYYLAGLKTETKIGIQSRFDRIHHIELSRTKDRILITQPIMMGTVNEQNTGVYYSQKLLITPKLSIAGITRLDYFYNEYTDEMLRINAHSNSFIFSPKINTHYQVNDRIQLYWYNGRGYHSNDTRVAVQQNGKKVVPPAYGSDLGGIFKIGNKLLIQNALWYLWLDQEFIYVGDEGVVEAGGKTQRIGIDLSARYQAAKYIYADGDISLAQARALFVPKEESYLPLAPHFTSMGGLTYRKETGWNGSLRYRYMANRPANETNSVIAKGYFILDAFVNYSTKKWELGCSVQNLLNSKWKETQFNTESKLQNEKQSVSEIHFTPGTPLFAKLHLAVFFR
jgi:outer membrane cobalamin receptor